MSRAERGLTLLEVLAAVALLGILYTALAATTSQGIWNEFESRQRLEASLLADEVLARIELDLRAGVPLERRVVEDRIDDFVVFHPLSREDVARIATIQFDVLKRRLADQEIDIELSGAAVDALVAEGYDPVYGARPLKRVIQRRIENPLAQRILAGDFPPGSTVEVTVADGEYQFAAAAAAA